MLYVDKEIEAFLQNGLIEESKRSSTAIIGGSISNVTNIGYDLVCKQFYSEHGEGVEAVVLKPGESVFAESAERIDFDVRTIGLVSLKNSRIRMGLSLEAPVYQPGHRTLIYFRLTNISDRNINLSAGQKYAMLMFCQLSKSPKFPYSGTFQSETAYKGLAGYESIYTKQLQQIEDSAKNLKDMEKHLYGNVLSILTIFIGIFTLLNINIDLVRSAASTLSFIQFNLACIGAISFLAVLLEELMHRKEARHWLWALPAAVFLILILTAFMK